MDVELNARLEAFLQSVPVRDLVDQLTDISESDRKLIDQYIYTSLNEVRTALDLFEPYLRPGIRILEVGAGLGIFGAFLQTEGYDITLLEPAAGGFEIFDVAQQLMHDYFSELQLNYLSLKAHQVSPHIHGEFELIFSVNVIEHIPELESTLVSLMSILKDQGTMVHLCPNYTVPYEPHFNCLVLKFWPSLTRKLYSTRIEKNATLWESLNFITYFEVVSIAKRHGWKTFFNTGVMFYHFARLDKDPTYKERQGSKFILVIYSILKYFRVISLIKFVPTFLSTPMLFELRKK